MEIRVAGADDLSKAKKIAALIADAAAQPGSAVARRSEECIEKKLMEGKAVIASIRERVVGFAYLELWDEGRYLSHSALVVDPMFRGQGVGSAIKKELFELSRTRFPLAIPFGLTTNGAVMKMNSTLGYQAVPFSEITQDDAFWRGCDGCQYNSILKSQERKNCLCTAMVCK